MAETEAAKSAKTEWEALLERGALRVLVVDDDEAHAETLADSLEIDGCVTRVAGSGREGVEAMEEEAFDAILTDLVMADLSGLEVLKAARRLQPDAGVLMVTGHASVETAVDAMRFGAGDYLTKPVRLAELRTQRLVDARRGRLFDDLLMSAL